MNKFLEDNNLPEDTIVIIVEGGCVTSVLSDKDPTILIVDFDNEECNDDDDLIAGEVIVEPLDSLGDSAKEEIERYLIACAAEEIGNEETI